MAPPEDAHPEVARLLRVKKFETPPPGYFQRLPGQIRARVEAEGPPAPAWVGWWRNLRDNLGPRPSLAGANLLILAGGALLLAGVGRSLLKQPDAGRASATSQAPVFCYDISTAGPNLDRVLSPPWTTPGGPGSGSPLQPALRVTPVLLQGWVDSNGTPVIPWDASGESPAHSVSRLR